MSTYETRTVTTVTTTSREKDDIKIGCHTEYLRTIPGILKIVEIVLSILVLICQSVKLWAGGGWVAFVAIDGIILSSILLVLYLTGLRSRFSDWFIIAEFICYVVITILWLIAAIVSAVRWTWHSSIAATCFFAFCATAVFAADTFIQFRVYRSGQTEQATTTQGTKTTTTTTTVESQKY